MRTIAGGILCGLSELASQPFLDVVRSLAANCIVVRLMHSAVINLELLVGAGDCVVKLSTSLYGIDRVGTAVKYENRKPDLRHSRFHSVYRLECLSSPSRSGGVVDQRVFVVRSHARG